MRKIFSRFLPLSALLLLVAATVPSVHSQVGAQTTVLASPAGPWLNVDGTIYYQALSAFWPVGSVHTLSVPQGVGYSYNSDQTVQWQFQGWSWSGGSTTAPTFQVTADPSVTRYTANFNSQYLLTIQATCNPAPCTGIPGTVAINGAAQAASPVVQAWYGPGSAVQLSAFANPGWLFSGWQVGSGTLINGPFYTVTVSAPMTVSAVFIPAKTISFQTTPTGLYLYADGVLQTAPTTLQWGYGTSHTVSGLAVQQDGTGKRWTYASWSDGGAETHTYVVGTKTNPETITANYAAAAYPIFTTSPPNLNLVVDGVVLPPPYSYIWGVGSTHQLTATTPQTDAQGNTWVFQSWDDGVATPSRTITIPVGADVNGYRQTALYTQQSQVKLTVGSSLPGQVVTVDGSPCTTPCTVTRSSGAQVHVSAPSSVPVSSASRQDFLGWSTNGGAPAAGDWAGTLTANTAISATYHLMNSLSASSNPSAAVRWTMSPASSDGYYDSQSVVQIAVSARPGYRFGSWSGDLSGTTPTGTLTMNVPHRVVAELQRVQRAAPIGTGNGAGAAGRLGVTAGSVAAIFGLNLAPVTATGPAAPLARTLAGVTVHIGDRQLPLYFASPTQINLQIPPDLATGPQTLTVSGENTPDVEYAVDVVRNAPQLFPADAATPTYAVVLHEDGSAVTVESPARQGELLSVYGTGFGPTNRVRPEGLAVPLKPEYRILDPVSVQVGGSLFNAESAFAAPGRVGLDVAQFRLDASAPSGAAIPFSVTVNGVSSNTLSLAVK